MVVLQVETIDEWNKLAIEHKEKKNVMVVYFSANWCGPCKALKPAFEALSEQYKNRSVVFLKIDIDNEALSVVADKFNVVSLPTTVIIKGCAEKSKTVGADRLGIQTGIDRCLNENSDVL